MVSFTKNEDKKNDNNKNIKKEKIKNRGRSWIRHTARPHSTAANSRDIEIYVHFQTRKRERENEI